METLIEHRKNRTIGQVLDYIKTVKRFHLPDAVELAEIDLSIADPEEITASRRLSEISNLRDIPYQEIINLAQFINEHTPFSTKHGVKRIEFENILVVLSRGWNLYNWNQFLEWSQGDIPKTKQTSYERNRNLFYVCCSRPKERLALLFTQELSKIALTTLNNWFGEENIFSITI